MEKFHNHIVPQTLYQWLYLIWFLVCLFAVWIIAPFYMNEAVPVFGLSLLFVWVTGWGFAWLIGCVFLGLKIEKEREGFKKSK